VVDALNAQNIEIPATLTALLDEFNGEIEALTPPPVPVEVEGDMLPVTKQIDDISSGDYKATVKTEADTDDAVADLDEAAEPRTAPVDINIVQYVIALALMAAVAAPRTARITAEAHTFA